MMQEEYLHYLFKYNFFNNQFITINGKALEVTNRGYHNQNAGPDFLEGKIVFDDKIWAGHIEFHVKASDWIKHGHQNDKSYHNVIAHFVYEYDRAILINDFEIPTVELKNQIDFEHYNHYLEFKKSKDWIPCAKQIHTVDHFIVFQQKEKALINRLIRKSELIEKDVKTLRGHQHQAFWIALAKVFGGKVNAEAFRTLVSKIKPYHLSKLDYNQTSIEAYCFGLAGFLSEQMIGDDYFDDLKSKYEYQKKLFNLEEMNMKSWKFSRMRPGNFPTVRLAQFATVIAKTKYYYKSFAPELLKDFEIELSSYWKTHYDFNKESKKENSGLTKSFKSLILINAYLPFLFAQGKIIDRPELKEKAIDSLNQIKAESNSIIRNWKQLKIPVKTAFDSQALIEQKNEICDKNKCLECRIGHAILKPKKAV